ncbi:hypothetical protein [Arthrobacter sp. UYP6]|uniref:hypothetical protein n=1 Tax=Arthrobacter sp. UYP6 TaxID=1756378 RepID=UPI003391519F
MKQRRILGGSVTAAFLAAGVITGCGSQNAPEDGGLASFGSLEEAYTAVDKVLGCEADPIGDPIVPMDGGQLTSEQRLCADHVQVDLYPDENAQQKSYEIWRNSDQGEVRLVRGTNWMVVDLTDVATEDQTQWDLEGLAKELNGEYTQAGS